MNTTHSDIIKLWPSIGVFAEDMGVKPSTAYSWKQRDKIPSDHWPRLLSCALVRRLPVVTAELLTKTQNGRRAA